MCVLTMIGRRQSPTCNILLGLSIIFLISLLFHQGPTSSLLVFNSPSHLVSKKHQPSLLIEVITAYSQELEPSAQVEACDCGLVDDITWDNDQWQRVEYKNIYLFSAFYDQRYKFHSKWFHFVRIISLVRDFIQTKLYCYLWSNLSNTTVQVVAAQAKELWLDAWGKGSSNTLYKAYLISCRIPTHLNHQIYGVSISSQKCSKPETYLPVDSRVQSLKAKDDFTVCVKALDFEKDISIRLIEWIEIQLLLGSSYITFYLFQVHSNTLKVLEYYQSAKKIKLIPLTLPGQLPNVPTERSQFLKDNIWQKRRLELVPYNDCFYR